MKIEKNTSEINPIDNVKIELDIVRAPKDDIVITTTITANIVLVERIIVYLIDLLTIPSACFIVVVTLTFCKFSRTRSNATIVSLIE